MGDGVPLYAGMGTGISTGVEGIQKESSVACFFAGGDRRHVPKQLVASLQGLTRYARKSFQNAPVSIGFGQNGAISSKIKRFP